MMWSSVSTASSHAPPLLTMVALHRLSCLISGTAMEGVCGCGCECVWEVRTFSPVPTISKVHLNIKTRFQGHSRVQVKARPLVLMVKVSVRIWVMYNMDESPHKAINTRMSVCVQQAVYLCACKLKDYGLCLPLITL